LRSTQLKIFMCNHCCHSWQLCALLFQQEIYKEITNHIQNRYKYKYVCYFIGFVCDFIDFVCEFTVKTTKHIVASYESSDFTWIFLTMNCKKIVQKFMMVARPIFQNSVKFHAKINKTLCIGSKYHSRWWRHFLCWRHFW
jgi:hypothetical protein